MNDQALSRLPDAARKAVERIWRSFSNRGGLAGLFITGSVARDLSPVDDLDLIVIWDHSLSDTHRRALVESCRGGNVGDPDTDHFHLHGIVPEFHFMAGKQQVQQLVSNFCWHGELPPESDSDRAEGLLASLVDALPVFDPEGLAYHWQKTLLQEFPQSYRLHRVHEQYTAACRRLAHFYRCGKQRDLLCRTRTRLEFSEHLVKALVVLNRRFYYGPKWVRKQLAEIDTKPHDAWRRLRFAAASENDAALREMSTLALD